jgi:hypothetical protein
MTRLKKRWLEKRFLRNARRALGLLVRLDLFMKAAGWPSWKIQQFWRDFRTSPRARAAQLAWIASLIGEKPAPRPKPKITEVKNER